jgi:hypothetical protein
MFKCIQHEKRDEDNIGLKEKDKLDEINEDVPHKPILTDGNEGGVSSNKIKKSKQQR